MPYFHNSVLLFSYFVSCISTMTENSYHREMRRNWTIFRVQLQNGSTSPHDCVTFKESTPILALLCLSFFDEKEMESEEEDKLMRNRLQGGPESSRSTRRPYQLLATLQSTKQSPNTSPHSSGAIEERHKHAAAPHLARPPQDSRKLSAKVEATRGPLQKPFLNPNRNGHKEIFHADVMCVKRFIDQEAPDAPRALRTISCCQSINQKCTYNQISKPRYLARCHSKTQESTNFLIACCKQSGTSTVSESTYNHRTYQQSRCY